MLCIPSWMEPHCQCQFELEKNRVAVFLMSGKRMLGAVKKYLSTPFCFPCVQIPAVLQTHSLFLGSEVRSLVSQFICFSIGFMRRFL